MSARVERLESRQLLSVSAVGPEFLVNTTTANDQDTDSAGRGGAIAMAADGDFVVTWSSYTQDGSAWGIFAQRYNAAGVAQGDEFQVNTTTDNSQHFSTVAMDADGDFVITWASYGQDGDGYGIYAQRYNAAGVAQGGEFLVNTTTEGRQNLAAVAMDADGDFVITWSSDGLDGDGVGVFAQRYNAAGVAQGDEFQVNTATANDQSYSTVAMDADGDFVVTWTSYGQDGEVYGVYAQRYNAAGVAQEDEFRVNTTTANNQRFSTVAMDADGDFVVTWSSYGQDGDIYGIYAQRYNAAGVAQDGEFRVNTTTTGHQRYSTVAIDADGDFVVIWQSNGQDGSGDGVYAQRYNAAGVAQGSEFRVNTTVAENQFHSSVAIDADGDFAVTWTSFGQDGSGYGVYAQRFQSNIEPVLANIETTPLSYAPNAPATAVTSTLTLTDADGATITGATIQISAGYQSGDVLGFANTANITGVFVAGTLTLTGSDTLANYQAALRSVTYASPSALARTVSFQVTDGIDPSNVPTRTVGGVAQLVGTALTVYGSATANNITIGEAATLDVVVDSVLSQFTPAQVTSVVVFGFEGNDSLLVNSLAGGTALTVYGMGGNDSLRVSAGVTQGIVLNGGAGNDLLVGGSGNDTLLGGLDNDWLNGGDGFDSLTGGGGNDVYAFGDASVNQVDTVTELAGEGTDLLHFGTVTTAVTVNLTSDTALASSSHRIVKVGLAGQSANFENVFGGSANDVVTGNASNNLLVGNGGNDTLNGGAGNDQLDGGNGADVLQGGNNDDVLIGGSGGDYLSGDVGRDLMDAGDGFNALAGGQGDDNYLFFAATVNQVDTVLEQIGEGVDTLNFAGLTTDLVIDLSSDTATAIMNHRIVQAGSGQSANFENATGGSGNDRITGNAGSNLLVGGGGNDTIDGGNGSDVLLGGIGNDTLKGTSGRNILIGGAGADLLLGGTGEDLLLSGSSLFETDGAVLQFLLAEWSSANTYQLRIDHLLGAVGGGANTGFLLSPSTVDNDNSADYLTGNGGRDWFLANSLQDVLTDKANDEVFTHIDTWV